MDAEDLAKAALKAIDDWLDEEIIGFVEPEGFEPEGLEPEGFEPEGRIESVCPRVWPRANWAIEEQQVASGA